jgi:hypothetical protein
MPVHLTLAEREFLLKLVKLEATSIGEEIEHAGDLDTLDAAVRGAQLHARLWRAAVEGPLELDAEVVEVLAAHRAGCLGVVRSDSEALRRLRAGTAHWSGLSIEESERQLVWQIDDVLEEVAGCGSLLGRAETA